MKVLKEKKKLLEKTRQDQQSNNEKLIETSKKLEEMQIKDK